MSKTILINRDSKDKIRVVVISYEWSDDEHAYIITRNTGQLNGKMSNQPDIIIKSGKANRTVTDQTKLEFNSKVKGYKDKGYKDIPKNLYKSIEDGSIDISKINELIPLDKTDSNGAKKVQLAKDFNKISNSTLEKEFYASRKLDGVRNTIYFTDSIKTASRGGINYDYAAQYILSDESLISFFEEYPNIILDGELYVHGKPLQWISGVCRIKSDDNKDYSRIEQLEYHIYDIIDLEDENKSFKDRLDFINTVLTSKFESNDKIKIVEHEEVSGWTAIEKLHNKFVEEGYEGLVLRDPNKEYKYGSRDNRMIKVKLYDEDEFEIIGFNEGKLRIEDFSFELKTKDGKIFSAKPVGTIEQRLDYLNNINNIIGKKASVKFFNYYDGKPQQPIFKTIRDYEN